MIDNHDKYIRIALYNNVNDSLLSIPVYIHALEQYSISQNIKFSKTTMQ